MPGSAAPPHTGVGFLGSEKYVSAEFIAPPGTRLLDGAELKRVNPDGSIDVVGTLSNGSWHRVGTEVIDGGVTAQTVQPSGATPAAHSSQAPVVPGHGIPASTHDGSSHDGSTQHDASTAVDDGPSHSGGGDDPETVTGLRHVGEQPDSNRSVEDTGSVLSEHFGRQMDHGAGQPIPVDGLTGRQAEARLGGQLAGTDAVSLGRRLHDLGDGSAAALVLEHSTVDVDFDSTERRPVGAHMVTVINRGGHLIMVDGSGAHRVEQVLPEHFEYRAWSISYGPDGTPVHETHEVPHDVPDQPRQRGERGPDSRIGGRGRDGASNYSGVGAPSGSAPAYRGNSPGREP